MPVCDEDVGWEVGFGPVDGGGERRIAECGEEVGAIFLALKVALVIRSVQPYRGGVKSGVAGSSKGVPVSMMPFA